MALSMDDKLLGEKVDNYCSSSEDEEERDDSGQSGDEEAGGGRKHGPTFIPEPEIQEYGGSCTNTGPKGVINDWREFKRLETEAKVSEDSEGQRLMTKLSMTCRSYLDDEHEKQKDEDFMQQFDDFEDDFMKEYRQKRIEEMRKALENFPKFGNLIALEKNNFIDAIDKEKPGVKIIVHVYEDNVKACSSMNGCLICLSREYPMIKFCKIKASDAKLSRKFSVSGVPALLVYQHGELISNFVRLSDEFGDDFYATDVESYLQEHGIMPSSDIMAKIVRDGTTGEIRGSLPQDDDSDFELD